MFTLFRQALFCLLLLWLPVSWAAESVWLTSPDNSHASVRFRADISANNETRILLDVKLEDGWKTYWRSPGEGGIAPTIRWQDGTPPVTWLWPVPSRFDVAGITTQGYHHQVAFPMQLSGEMPAALNGVLTLSTCSNVCLLTDFAFSMTTTHQDPEFAHDYLKAMGQVPLSRGLTESLKADYRAGELLVEAVRAEGWSKPDLYLDNLGDAVFGKPNLRIEGENLQARIPVSDSWGDEAPNITGNSLTLVLVDNEIAQETQLKVGAAAGGGL